MGEELPGTSAYRESRETQDLGEVETGKIQNEPGRQRLKDLGYTTLHEHHPFPSRYAHPEHQRSRG